ncbi:MAG: hypothetical protein KGZ49_05435 [Syntrophaceae bacterium]|nr:hypothetical protein [Syntrophaceae bacterium]
MGFPISLPSDRLNVNRLLPKSVSCFDKPVLSEPFTLREPQGERRVKGLSMTGKVI